jgi:hypothetical protein
MASGLSTKQNIKIVIYILLVIIGLVVLPWPEDNLMLVQFNESHGPSTLDSVGIAIILAGYLPMIIQVFRNFSNILLRIGKNTTVTLVIVAILSAILIPVALIQSSDALLWISVAICTIAESILIFFAFRGH